MMNGIKKILVVLSLALATCAFAQDTGRMLFVDKWHFILGDNTEYAKADYDDSGWRVLNLPHDWAIEGDFDMHNPSGTGGGALPGGIGWYRKTFNLDKSEKKNLFRIDFDGVYMNATVYVNGHKLGTRPYGYISFGYDITPYLKFGGSNTIAVRVDNKEQPNSRWYSGCGIYRNVYLTKLSPIHIAPNGVYVTSQVNGAIAKLTVQTTLATNKMISPHLVLVQNVINANGISVYKQTMDGYHLQGLKENTVTMELNLPRFIAWDVDNPYLYTLETILYQKGEVVDTYKTRFGVRSFEFSATDGFVLNGKKLQIQGVCNHHDLGCLGAAVNRRAIQRQLQILKDMGVNGIRCSHNPPAPELLDLCDEMGFVVMDEAFDMWRKKKTAHDYSRYFNEWHERDLRDLVVRDRNHPSVFIWSIGNEVLEQWSDANADTLSLEEANLILNFGHSAETLAKDGTVSVNSLLCKKLVDFVHSIDSTRPVTAGCNEPSPWNHLFASGALDIIGFNYHNQNIAAVSENFPGKPFIITESVSALQTRGYYRMPSDSMYVWPERWDKPFYDESFSCSSYDNCHAPWSNTHEENLLIMKKYPWISGQYIWTGFDYIGEPTPYGWPARSSYFGIVDLAGFPKDVYYLYKSELTDKQVLHLFPHWNWIPGQAVDMWCYYNNADEVELFVNGVSQGISRKTDDRLHAFWRVTFEPGEVKAVARKDGKEIASKTIKTAGRPATLRLTADRSTMSADGRDLSYVTVEVLDKDGNLCPNADNLVTFNLKGSSVCIAGVDNGSPISLERFKDDKRHAFYGKALVVLQSNAISGETMLEASSEGLQSAQIKVVCK